MSPDRSPHPSDASLPGTVAAPRRRWSGGRFAAGLRVLPEELPISLTFNRTAHAVMLASPTDLEDFAIGFSLADGIIDHACQVERFQAVPLREADGTMRGIEARMHLDPALLDRLDKRRRYVAGPSGCGLCGVESLDAALQPVRRVTTDRRWTPAQIAAAVASLRDAQLMNRDTRAVHAAGFWKVDDGLALLREDIGRHNALDKLHGALARTGRDAGCGIVAITSRISVELVQKAAAMGAPLLAAISAPTSLAIATADRAGITLVAVARDDGFELFTHPDRVEGAQL